MIFDAIAVAVTCDPPLPIYVSEDVLNEVLSVIGELRADSATEEEIARAKRRQRIFLEFAQDSPGELAGWFGMTELFRTPESFEERLTATDKLTQESLRELAQKYLGGPYPWFGGRDQVRLLVRIAPEKVTSPRG